MFFSVIVGYVLAALFAFAGAIQIAEYIKHVDRSLGYAPFIGGLAESCIWLGAAVAIVLLIQIATFLEKLVMEGKKQPLADLGALAPERTHERGRGDGDGLPAPSPVSASEQPTRRTAPGQNPSVADPEAPRVPDLPGAGSSLSSSSQSGRPSEEDQGLHYFKM